ncbi:MAG: hypothetical protein JRN56_02355, partial [Nitrososphaerota archaeon]|nr:hypothetical protein [Nitrososphaerota archaeon]
MALNWKTLFPYEIFEPNWRFWSFVGILVVGFWALLSFPVAEYAGYIDPFYSPTILIVPLPGLFRLTCYAYRKDYHRHLFRHPVACEVSNFKNVSKKTDLVGEKRGRLYSG